MKRKIKLLLTVFVICFINILSVSADIVNPGTTGNSGSLGSLGDGAWDSTRIGIKVSIISSSGTLKDVEIILNKKCTTCLYSSNNYPKIMQSSTITWISHNYNGNINSSILGSIWTYKKDGTTYYYDLNSKLVSNNYANLKTILSTYFSGLNFENGDYILVEPMTAVGKYYGTAYELGNAFLTLGSSCNTKGTFCWTYAGALFGGSSSKPNGGLFWQTIYYDNSKLTFGSYSLSKYSGSSRTERHKCLKSSTCSRGIGVYKYSDLYPQPTTGTLKINKTNNLGNRVTGAQFTLYSNSNCSGTGTTKATANGVIDFGELTPGTYSVRETKKASNYYNNPSGECKSVYVGAGQNKELSFTNTLSCQYFRDQIVDNYRGEERKQYLIKLYQGNYSTAQGDYSNYNGLLNFNDPQCKPINCSYSDTDTNCLTTYRSSNLSQKYKIVGGKACKNQDSLNCEDGKYYEVTDLSCYNDTITINNKKFYCITGFTMNKTSNVAIPNNKNKKFINSGRFYLKSASNIATSADFNGTLWKHCYIYGVSDSEIVKVFKSEKYTDYISNVKLYDKEEDIEYQLTNLNTNKVFGNPENTGHTYRGFYRFAAYANYKLPAVYLVNGSGKISSTNCANCKFGGYGIMSQFNFIGDKTLTYIYEFRTTENIFEVEYYVNGDNDRKTTYINNDRTIYDNYNVCEYSTTQQVIKKDELQLEFRLVSTNSSTAFLDENGVERESGANWSDTTDREQVLDIQNNSYNRTGVGPKYKITLTPSDIEKIVEYNKKTTYDDYTLYCENDGNDCYSRFLDGLESGTLQFYDVESNKFTSSWLLRNRLTINKEV